MRSLSACLAMLVSATIAGPSPARADPADSLTGLVDAAVQRLQIAEPVAAVKWNTGAAVEDPTRVRAQLAALAADATAEHLDSDYVTRVFGDQIDATAAVEYHRFAEWKLDPSGVPAAPQDLSVSRAVIDALNRVMLAEIGRHWDLLHSPDCAGRLEEARRDVSAARQLDAYYQRALSYASRSYCRP